MEKLPPDLPLPVNSPATVEIDVFAADLKERRLVLEGVLEAVRLLVVGVGREFDRALNICPFDFSSLSRSTADENESHRYPRCPKKSCLESFRSCKSYQTRRQLARHCYIASVRIECFQNRPRRTHSILHCTSSGAAKKASSV